MCTWTLSSHGLYERNYRCDQDTRLYLREWQGEWWLWNYVNPRADLYGPYDTLDAAKFAVEIMFF